MKPLGPIPPGFASRNGVLTIDGQQADALVDREGGTPLFIYSSRLVRERIAQLRAAMPAGVVISYAVKANPFTPLLQMMAGCVDGFDVASEGELRAALAAGMDGERVSFAGPGKRDDELEAAIQTGATLYCESGGEARRIVAAQERLGRQARVALRVNPDFELRGSGMKMGGGARPFGIDVDQVPEIAQRIVSGGCEWRGWHIFAGSQTLDTQAIIAAQRATIALAARLSEAIGHAPPEVNLGGGFGIPYFAGDTPIDLPAIGDALRDALESRPTVLGGTSFRLELGRYLVGQAGVYLTRVLDRKTSGGETFLVTDGGLHHQLAASGNFGTVVRRNYPVAIATRFGRAAEEVATIVGCLCTPLDRLADRAPLPVAQAGDLVAVFCAGAYGASASPAAFLGHGPAREVLL